MPPQETDAVVRRLRDHGLRATATRLAVYRAVCDLPDHPSVETIAARVRAEAGPVSTQAIYDGLGALSEIGLVRRIEPAGSPGRFETRAGDNHHHIVCRACGAVQDVDCVVGRAPCLDPSDTGGFVIDEAEITFWGLCPRCTAASSTRKESHA